MESPGQLSTEINTLAEKEAAGHWRDTRGYVLKGGAANLQRPNYKSL